MLKIYVQYATFRFTTLRLITPGKSCFEITHLYSLLLYSLLNKRAGGKLLCKLTRIYSKGPNKRGVLNKHVGVLAF